MACPLQSLVSRWNPGRHMAKIIVLLVAVISDLGASAGNSRLPFSAGPPQETSEKALMDQAGAIRLTIATFDPRWVRRRIATGLVSRCQSQSA